MNLVIIKGNVTRDPEMRYLPNGTAVCDLGVAVNRTWIDQNGEKKEEVNFFDCQAWAKTAEIIAQYFKKGKPILVQGRLKQDTWEDKKTGDKRSKVRIVVDRFEFCGDTKDNANRSPAEHVQRDAPEAAQATPSYDSGDNVPF